MSLAIWVTDSSEGASSSPVKLCQFCVIDSGRMRKLLFLFCIFHVSLLGQQRPLITERAETLSRGHVLFDVGTEFLRNASFPFSGLRGNLTKAGVLGLRVGAADNIELQILGAVQNVLNISERFSGPNTSRLNFSGNSTNDVGDFSLATKVRVISGIGSPSIALRFGVELPNASNEGGLGNDETNAFGSLLIEKDFGRIRFLGNTGIVILGDPSEAGSQDDLFTYGFAAIYELSSHMNFLVDLYGREGPGGVGTENQSVLRLGTQLEAMGLYWDAALFLGLKDTDPDSGLVIGVSKEFRFLP